MSDLALLPDQCFELIESVGHDASDIRQRWSDRVVLERSSVSKLYLNNRVEILLYGEWLVGDDKVDWVCRIRPDYRVLNGDPGKVGVHPGDLGHCNGGQNEVVLVVVVEGVEGPKGLVMSIGRPYFVKKKVDRPWECSLYRVEVLNGISFGGYKFISILPHGEMSLALPSCGTSDAGREVIESPPQIVDSIPDYERDELVNRLSGFIAECKSSPIILTREGARFHADAMPVLAKWRGLGHNLFDMAVGPLDL